MNDTILIGNNLVTYMAAIYLKTSGLNILVLKKEDDKDYEFDGYDMIPGTPLIKNQRHLVSILETQARNLGCCIIEEEITGIQKREVIEIFTSNVVYKTKSLLLDNQIYKLEFNNVFDTSDGVKFNQAIEFCGFGCRLSFKVRDNLN